MDYDGEYVDGVKAQIALGIDKPKYGFSIGDEGDKLNTIAPLAVIRFLDNLEDLDQQSRIAKLSSSGKKIVLSVNGERFGDGFKVSGTDYEWETFREFQEHPMALMTLFEICSSAVLKNSKLLRSQSPVATAVDQAGPAQPQ